MRCHICRVVSANSPCEASNRLVSAKQLQITSFPLPCIVVPHSMARACHAPQLEFRRTDGPQPPTRHTYIAMYCRLRNVLHTRRSWFCGSQNSVVRPRPPESAVAPLLFTVLLPLTSRNSVQNEAESLVVSVMLSSGISLRERSGSTPENFRKIPDLSPFGSGKWPFWAQKRRNSRKTGYFAPFLGITPQILRESFRIDLRYFPENHKFFHILQETDEDSTTAFNP